MPPISRPISNRGSEIEKTMPSPPGSSRSSISNALNRTRAASAAEPIA